MPTSIEAQGVTVDEAIQIALNRLGVSRDSVEIEILHHPRSGFLGIGARRAKVRATVRKDYFQDGEEYDMSVGDRASRGRRGRRQSRRRRTGRGGARERGAGAEEKTPQLQPKPRAAGERERPSGDRKSAETRSRQSPAREQQTEPPRREGEGGRRSRRRRGGEGRDRRASGGEPGTREGRAQESATRQGRAEEEASASAAAVAVDTTPTAPPAAAAVGQQETAAAETVASSRPGRERAREDEAAAPRITREEALERSVAVVRELMRRMGFTAEVTGEIDEKDDEIVVRVNADAEGLLIGRRGQTLDAAEHLVNRMVFTGEAGNESRIALDVGGYRDRRREALHELAGRLKERAVAQGRRVQVSPMSPRDRRILQEALASDATIETRVLGSGFYRRVLICPVGLADESAPIDDLSDENPAGTAGDEAHDSSS